MFLPSGKFEIILPYTTKNIFFLYTSDMPEYKGAFILGDFTCRQEKIDF
jgi:hypothetical protein